MLLKGLIEFGDVRWHRGTCVKGNKKTRTFEKAPYTVETPSDASGALITANVCLRGVNILGIYIYI